MDFNCTKWPTARKPHRCQECGRVIDPGERYSRTAAVWEGDFFTNVACGHCARARMVADYADIYFGEGYYDGGLSEWMLNDSDPRTLRLRAGFAAKWRYQSGALMPLPMSPWADAPRLIARLAEVAS